MVERRVRSWWIVRERYRRVAWAASALGGGLAALPLVAVLREDGAGTLGSVQVLAASALLVAAGVLVPRWAVMGLWRRERHRREMDWP